ncbi:TonB-dependent receptor [Qipengyuania atrilutea]|uniref:TonB-dependent receptor n=1 Tax=Qipengyuania atrilutea TaxID=2744473 RepID=A0A850H750_9SPHN|nr:TonB-dependent receptor [Actirhodobacter atriluteus]NVD45633.1 TonB-dependent receptor [Actirhodobacter atriluteus]
MKSPLRRISAVAFLTASASLPIPVAAIAQEANPEAEPGDGFSQDDDENVIIVTAPRIRGQVDTDVPPIAELDEADIAALGAGSLEEVLEEVGSQAQSGSGRGDGRPIILVNGRRVSSFRELRSYPPEALKQVQILPEEVALQYGYPPTRRVVNFILKDNFESKEVEVEYRQPARGGFNRTELEGTYLRIAGRDRLNLNVEWEQRTTLTEAERGVVLTDPVLPGDPDPALYRSLIGAFDNYEATANWSRGLGEEGAGGSLALNATFEREDSRSREGLGTVRLFAPDGSSAFRSFGADSPLLNIGRTDTYSLGSNLDLPVGDWQLTWTTDASRVEVDAESDLDADTLALREAALAGLVDIAGPLPAVADGGVALASSETHTVGTLATLVGELGLLPAGAVTATFDTGYNWRRIDSRDTRRTGEETQLTRGDLSAGFNLGVPIASAREDFLAPLGTLTLNLSAGVNHLSDFGTLTDASAGLIWRPAERLSLQTTYTIAEAPPGLGQLGNPVIVTSNVPVFDFATGDTVLVELTTGGNPFLLAETQRDWKVSADYEFDLLREARLTLEYFTNSSRDVTAGFPLLTPAIEAAFPERIVRDASGALVALDRTPVTFAETDSSRLRASFSLSGAIGKEPQREERGEGERGGKGGGNPAAMLGGGRGEDRQGRWRTSLDYTYALTDTVRIADNGPLLDQLGGDATGADGGAARHVVSANAFGWYQGYGGFISADYRSATRVNGSELPGSSDLFFGDLFKVDLRVFTDLERVFPDTKALKGVRLSARMDNVFDTRQGVTDENGLVPSRYQPFLIDPVGRYIGFEVRKLF